MRVCKLDFLLWFKRNSELLLAIESVHKEVRHEMVGWFWNASNGIRTFVYTLYTHTHIHTRAHVHIIHYEYTRYVDVLVSGLFRKCGARWILCISCMETEPHTIMSGRKNRFNTVTFSSFFLWILSMPNCVHNIHSTHTQSLDFTRLLFAFQLKKIISIDNLRTSECIFFELAEYGQLTI